MCSIYCKDFNNDLVFSHVNKCHSKEKHQACYSSFYKGQLDCRLTNIGKEYVGLKNVTMSGFTCQDWSSQYPHKHRFSKNEFLRQSRNYCRNPDGEPQGPWCYTTNKNIRWQYCGITFCRKLFHYTKTLNILVLVLSNNRVNFLYSKVITIIELTSVSVLKCTINPTIN